jgi:hypothetical protein
MRHGEVTKRRINGVSVQLADVSVESCEALWQSVVLSVLFVLYQIYLFSMAKKQRLLMENYMRNVTGTIECGHVVIVTSSTSRTRR